VLVVERNFIEFSGEVTRDQLGKCHKPGLRVGRHGEVASERASAVSCADTGSEDEGVAVVEGDNWLDED
jgi:hypothetical protein